MTLYFRKMCIFVNDYFSARKPRQFFTNQLAETFDFSFRIKALKFRLNILNYVLHGTKITQMC